MDAKTSVKSRSISPIASRSRNTHMDPTEIWRQLTTPELEKKEVSSTLSFIRKLHDSTKDSNIKKRGYIEKLRKELEKSKGLTISVKSDHKEMEGKIETFKQNLENTQFKYEEEIKNRNIYQHVLNRMKINKLSMEKRANDLRSDLRKSVFVLGSESEKLRRAKESNFQLRSTINEMRHSLDADKKSKMMELELLQKTFRMRSEALLRREEREKRHQVIAEATADFEKNSNEMIMRESLLMHRFWFSALEKRAKFENIKREKLERAFGMIKSSTDANSVEDMVQMFLTREASYAQLIQNIEETEKKLEQLKSQNMNYKKEMNEVQLMSGIAGREYREIQKMDQQIEDLRKESEKQKAQVDKYSKMYDEVSIWTVRMARLLKVSNPNTVTHSTSLSWGDESLFKLFNKLADKLSETLPSLNLAVSDSDWGRITQELEFGIRTETTFSRLNRVGVKYQHDTSGSDM